MSKVGRGFQGLVLCVALCAPACPATAMEDKQIALGDCKVFVHSSSGTIVAICGDDHYYGTSEHVMAFKRGDVTEAKGESLTVKYTEARSDGKAGLLVYCASGNRFYASCDDTAWSRMPKGKETCPVLCRIGNDDCSRIPALCAAHSPSTAKTSSKHDSHIVQAGKQWPSAPGVTLIEGEKVRPDEAMVFTRSVLVEEGASVAAMSRLQENISNVRYNMNSYRLGYAVPATKSGDRYQFHGSVKGWRATSTGDVSVWPPFNYRVSRDEAMRRARLLQPVAIAEEMSEMNNLRLYYLPSLVGHDGRNYQTVHQTIAFFIHPKTGYRMTVLMRDGRTYGTVNKPLAATSHIFVKHTEVYNVGPFGLGEAHIPSVFFTRRADFDMEPFAAGDNLERMMQVVLHGHQNGPLAAADFKALYDEMSRYTGGKTE